MICRACKSNLRDQTVSWVTVEPGSAPLCSDCSGTEADAREAIERACEELAKLTNQNIANARRIANAARLRREARRMRETPGLATPIRTR